MKLSCKTYQDLIHLYIDNVLSDESTVLVEGHIAECDECQAYLTLLQEDLPTPPLTEDTSKEALLAKKLHKRLILTQWLFLLGGMLLSSTLVMTDNIFQNILFLPLIGLAGYYFTKKIFIIPLATSIVLCILSTFVSSLYSIGTPNFLSSLLSELFGMVLIWGTIYFLLTLIGSLIGVMLHHCSLHFREKKLSSKLFTISLYVLVVLISALILFFYNGSNGNPFTAIYARAKMNAYMEENYPQYNYIVHDVGYNFKSGGYSADAYMYTGEASRPFTIYYRAGNVQEDYYNLYVEDMGTSLRLAGEAEKEIESLLQANGLPFYSVSASISVPIDKYDDIAFNVSTVTEPLSISIYKYTDTKESPEAFAKWCESIRQALVSAGYHLEDISFDSDPHFMIARLGLTLHDKEIFSPITDVTSYNGFTDYAALNGYDNLSPLEWENAKKAYSKDTIVPDKDLSAQASLLLQDLPFEIVDAEVFSYTEDASIRITWTGKPITPNTFAEQCLLIKDAITESPNPLNIHGIYDMHFSYYSGSSQNSYYYSLGPENLNKDVETIVLELLSNEKYLMNKR